MAQQTINVGTAPNDGTGDTLKTSFTKCNQNFTELYTTYATAASVVLKADLASPTFTGDPKAPTPTAGDNDTSIATTAFVQGVNTKTTFGVRGLVGSSSATSLIANFAEAVLHNSSGVGVFVSNIAGMAIAPGGAVGAGGPDATLAAAGDVHFYAIWNGTVCNGICSAASPPTGPALPSGYTHWCYLTTIKRISSTLQICQVRGNKVFYQTNYQILNTANSGGVWTAASVAGAVPAIALSYNFSANGGAFATAAAAIINFDVGVTGTSLMQTVRLDMQNGGVWLFLPLSGTLPNVSQTFYHRYFITGGTFSGSSFNFDIVSYEVPNGS